MAAVAFPSVKPTGRSYTPGSYPITDFVALNGATTRMLYGNRRSNAELNLDFQNISDDKAALILQNYERVTPSADWISFTSTDAATGASTSLANYIREVGGSGLRWRYASPPQVTGVFPGVSTVTCKLVAMLDG